MIKYKIHGVRDVKSLEDILTLFERIEDLVVEEKIDGILIIISNEKTEWPEIYSKGGNPIARSRMGETEKKEILSYYRNLDWTYFDPTNVFYVYTEYIPNKKPEYLHKTYKKEYRGRAYLLDVQINNKFMNYEEKLVAAREVGLEVPKIYERLNCLSLYMLKEIVKKLYEGVYKSDMTTDNEPEGIVIKNYISSKGKLAAFKVRKNEDKNWFLNYII